MIGTPNCFKCNQGRCIDLMLTKEYSAKDTQTFKTGFSCFHHLIYSVFKSQSTKFSPKIKRYSDHRKYPEVEFLIEVSSNVAQGNPKSIDSFTKLFEKTLNKYAPFKVITIRGNNKPHMSKALRKAIVLRTKLKNISIKTRNNLDIQRYCQQHNLVVKLNKRAKL